MDVEEKLKVLGAAAKYDACASPLSEQRPWRGRGDETVGRGIYRSVLPGGRCARLFKVLQSNACANDCFYCAHRCGAGRRRAAFRPEELARLFMDLFRRRAVDGLFLSSAIPGSANAMQEEMVKTVEILREKHGYRGYVHLKILPGVALSLVERSAELADRVSINLEAPTDDRLSRIAPKKSIRRDVLEPLLAAKRLREERGLVPAGITTQFVVGAARETDREILRSAWWLYRNAGLSRAYYSALVPLRGTPLEGCGPPSPVRQHRLYQTDWLIRKYGFSLREIVLGEGDNLPLDKDPKLAWAERHAERFPVEINRAAYGDLLRVPGIGEVSARKIVERRRRHRLRSLEELKGLRIPLRRARDFILLDGRLYPTPGGKNAAREPPAQLLFDI